VPKQPPDKSSRSAAKPDHLVTKATIRNTESDLSSVLTSKVNNLVVQKTLQTGKHVVSMSFNANKSLQHGFAKDMAFQHGIKPEFTVQPAATASSRRLLVYMSKCSISGSADPPNFLSP